jgi:uncharacterized protein VirK/YbjX
MERVKLNIRGILKEKLIKNYSDVLNYERSHNEKILFCDYSDYDIPLHHTFTSVKIIKSQRLFDTIIRLKSVTQEYGQPFDLIPKGHKTICNFIFLNENFENVMEYLPIVADWYDSENILEFI